MAMEKMPPPGLKKPDLAVAVEIEPKPGMRNEDDDAQGKESEADAIVLRGGEKTCESCAHYRAESGDCEKVQGQFGPDDRCLRYYDAGSEQAEEMNEDMSGSNMGEMPPPGME
jgi:hypothetical protein